MKYHFRACRKPPWSHSTDFMSAVSPVRLSRIVLASASPRRSELLRQMGLRFIVCPAAVEEWEATDAAPDTLVCHNAALKAKAVAAEFPDDLILAADTTVALGGRVFHKPASLMEAREMLSVLSGQTHTVYTGFAFYCAAAQVDRVDYATSRVTFKTLSPETIEAYIGRVNPLDKAGAYGIQEGREMIIADLDGSLSNVMGLPTECLQARLQAQGLWEGLLL